jgi:hypothetical protein
MLTEVMEAILQSGEGGTFTPITTTCDRPETPCVAAPARLDEGLTR